MAEEKQDMDRDLADSITMLEQILEVMPQDSMALKALYNAYLQCGQRDRAFEYLSLLADVAHANNDAETARFVAGNMQGLEDEYPAETSAQCARLRGLVSSGTEPRAAAQTFAPSRAPSADVDISEELALAWRLYEENQLSQEEYSSILNDLTEVSSKDLDVPISVLHVLHDRGFNQMNRIMNYLSSRSNIPYISLAGFELPTEVKSVLPLNVAVHDGALPFAFFGNDLLIGVLNPFNSVLMDKAEKSSGHRCHAYLVAPDDYDVALGKLREMVKKDAA